MDTDPPDYNPEATWEQPRLGNLAAALAKVQAELPHIDKSKTAEIEGREGRRGYKYKYADLADVSEAVLPILGKHGLAFTTWPTRTDDGRFVLAYTLWHESGERRDGEYPLPSNVSSQQLGSALTYGRRYLLCAVTGVAAEDDDDGANAPKMPAEKPQPRQSQRQARPAGNSTPTPSKDGMPPAQAISMHWKRLGVTDRDERLSWTARMAGRTELESTTNLAPEVQQHILDALSQCRDMAKVQAWIDDKVAAS